MDRRGGSDCSGIASFRRTSAVDNCAPGPASKFGLLLVKAPEGPFSDLNLLQVKQKISAMHAVLDDALTPQENLF